MKNGIKIKNGSGIMKYNIKLSKGKININGKEYDIPDEVLEFIIYETSTRDDIIQTRDAYKRTIDKAIEYNDHLIRDAKYRLNLGHLKKMKKILKGDSNE